MIWRWVKLVSAFSGPAMPIDFDLITLPSVQRLKQKHSAERDDLETLYQTFISIRETKDFFTSPYF
jgi:phenylalanine-4-hydroxylase